MVKDLGFASSSVGNESVSQNVKDILADLLKFQLDLGPVLLDGADVLVGTLGLLLLLDGGDDAPGGTAGTDDVLVGDAEQVTFVNGELAAELGYLLHIEDHLIVALRLLAQSGEESLAVAGVSVSLERRGAEPVTAESNRMQRTFHARFCGYTLANGLDSYGENMAAAESLNGRCRRSQQS